MNSESYKFTQLVHVKQETRWADIDEIKANTKNINLTDESYPSGGLPIINNGKTAWIDATDTHSIIFGSTGSKKTRLFCMPLINILIGAGESFIATDPKGELFNITSGLAEKRGYKVIVLNYRDLSRGDTWNPLALPYELYHKGMKDEAYEMLNDFLTALTQKQLDNSRDVFWINAARSVSLAILMLMLETCTHEECNMKTFTQFCVEFGKAPPDKYMEIAYAIPEEDKIKNYLSMLMEMAPDDNIAKLNYLGIASSSDKARGDVQSTLFTIIQTFLTQDNLVRNMAHDSFDIRRIATEKTALYLIVPDEKTTFHFIASTFVKQCYEILIGEAQQQPNRMLPLRVNFVLDEFANMPPIPDIPAMITAARSRNMRFYLVVQSMNQLLKRYGHDADTIKGNCDNWVFLTSKELGLLKEISELCGNLRTSEQRELKTPLISISQLQRLSKKRGEALIFNKRQYPFISELADIADCCFENCAPFEMPDVSALMVACITPIKMHEEIEAGHRAVPFGGKVTEKGSGSEKDLFEYLEEEIEEDFEEEIEDEFEEEIEDEFEEEIEEELRKIQEEPSISFEDRPAGSVTGYNLDDLWF